MNSEAKVALVTGASRGIGRAIATHLSKLGFIVVGTATTDKGAKYINDYLSEINKECLGLALDISDSVQLKDFFEKLNSSIGMPLIIINNAGIVRDNIFIRMSHEEWSSVIDTNLKPLYEIVKPCLKNMMKSRWGRIINIGSVIGSVGNLGQANYSASKAGIEGFSRALAAEFGSRSITVNTIAPGFIDTDMTSSLPDEKKAELLKGIPLARLGKPEEIASTVGFLVSEEASYITGQTIHVNGGMYMG
jgi:3-oxoacyl-[acyl-carrier protein] reductase